MSAPRPRSPSTTVAIRSDSLTRSSCAPRTTVSPSAKQPSSATSGSSSIASGTSSARPPCRAAAPAATSRSLDRLARREPSRLGARARRARSPPIRCEDPQEAGARPVDPDVARRSRREPGTSTPAAIKNAAEVGSPGTSTSSSTSSSTLTHGHVRARRGGSSTPARSSIRSVWSRLRRRLADRRRAVGGQRRRAARTTSPARSPPAARSRSRAGARPRPRSGGKRPSLALELARPSARSGSAIAVDRAAADRLVAVEREAARPPGPASQPGSSRISVPALPTSIGPSGSRGLAQAGAAHDELVARVPRRARRAPRTASSVESVSAASR